MVDPPPAVNNTEETVAPPPAVNNREPTVTPPHANLSPDTLEMIISTVTTRVTDALIPLLPQRVPAEEAYTPVEVPPQTRTDALVESAIANVRGQLSGEKDPPPPPTHDLQTVQFSLDTRVSTKTKAKIWNNVFLEFGILLSNPWSEDKYQLSVSSFSGGRQPSICLEPTTRPKRNLTMEMWTSAFRIFVAVYTQKYPNDAPALMKYVETIFQFIFQKSFISYFRNQSKSKVKNLKDTNTRRWWREVKNLTGQSMSQGEWYSQLIDDSSIASVDNLCKKINEFFVQLTSDFRPLLPHDVTAIVVPDVPDHFLVSSYETYKSLRGILTNKAPGPDWRYYDETFRTLRQVNPSLFAWANIHSELWLRSHVSVTKSASTGRIPNKSHQAIPKGFCYRFHSGKACSSCNFKHACYLCSAGSHPATKCFRPQRQQPGGQSEHARPQSSNPDKK
ncbi:uncharacterized protein LOC116608298 [Nematostella vectensis]|uniref:uncharacterized protein LOC116608298 n=1 Tax=Nematostella vectensis TaxID=45351 RepID=UPI002077269D|nr:uncharacterized protein LOC116608298 [Nematostella vectensis]